MEWAWGVGWQSVPVKQMSSAERNHDVSEQLEGSCGQSVQRGRKIQLPYITHGETCAQREETCTSHTTGRLRTKPQSSCLSNDQLFPEDIFFYPEGLLIPSEVPGNVQESEPIHTPAPGIQTNQARGPPCSQGLLHSILCLLPWTWVRAELNSWQVSRAEFRTHLSVLP